MRISDWSSDVCSSDLGVEGSPVKAGRHRLIERIARVLPVDHLGHAPERGAHLILRHYAVTQPVGDMLAGDAQGRAVFHQANVADVRHLGTAARPEERRVGSGGVRECRYRWPTGRSKTKKINK